MKNNEIITKLVSMSKIPNDSELSDEDFRMYGKCENAEWKEHLQHRFENWLMKKQC